MTAIVSSKVKNIDATTMGTTNIFSSLTSNFRPLAYIVDLTSVSGYVSAPNITIGSNSASYDNLLASTSLSLTSANTSEVIPCAGVISDIGSSTEIVLNVSAAADASTYLINITVIGFYDT